MSDLNLPFKFFATVGDVLDDITYSCDSSPTSPDHLVITWTEDDEQEYLAEYTREEVTNFVNKGLWIIVGENNA